MLTDNPRGPVSAAAVIAPIVLAADAVAAFAMTVPVTVQLFWTMADFVIQMFVGLAAIALICPAVAALVGGVRTWAAHLTGCVVTALIAVAFAGLTALALNNDLPGWVAATTAGLFVANMVAVFLLTGRLRVRPTIGGWPSSPRSPSV